MKALQIIIALFLLVASIYAFALAYEVGSGWIAVSAAGLGFAGILILIFAFKIK